MKKYKNILLIWIVAIIIGLVITLFPRAGGIEEFRYGFPLVWYERYFGNEIVINNQVSSSDYTNIQLGRFVLNIIINTSILGGLGTLVLRLKKNKKL